MASLASLTYGFATFLMSVSTTKGIGASQFMLTSGWCAGERQSGGETVEEITRAILLDTQKFYKYNYIKP